MVRENRTRLRRSTRGPGYVSYPGSDAFGHRPRAEEFYAQTDFRHLKLLEGCRGRSGKRPHCTEERVPVRESVSIAEIVREIRKNMLG